MMVSSQVVADAVNPFATDPVKALHFAYCLLLPNLPPVLIFDIRALWHSVLSGRVPECKKLKMAARPVWR